MTTNSKSIVWILGAGFSKPLGGPLLTELFAHDLFETFSARFGSVSKPYQPRYPKLCDGYARVAHKLYQTGLLLKVLWTNAEEYLAFLDTAAFGTSESPQARRLATLVESAAHEAGVQDAGIKSHDSLKKIRAAARRLLAAECAGFLLGNDVRWEGWDPYHQWASSLTPHDSVITFNYDLVVETLFSTDSSKVDNRGFPINVVLPDAAKSGESGGAGAQLFKLHGSVNWLLRGAPASPVVEQGDPDAALTCEDSELVIASPGPEKYETTRKLLSPLWTQALTRIQEANAVVFVGYRFPPTDAFSRKELLRGLRTSTAQGPKYFPQLAVHTVLGEQVNDRMTALLRHALVHGGRRESPPPPGQKQADRSFRLYPQPLLAQDFFTVCTREGILEPWQGIEYG